MPAFRPLFVLAVLACGCGEAPADPAPVPADAPEAPASAPADDSDTVLGVAAASADLSTFAELSRAAGFDAVLRDTSQTLTVFAPSNAAFAALPAATLDGLRADPAALRALLAGHVLPYRLFSGDVTDEQATDALDGEIVLVPGPQLRVQFGAAAASVVTPDLDAANGVVHVVDAVLVR